MPRPTTRNRRSRKRCANSPCRTLIKRARLVACSWMLARKGLEMINAMVPSNPTAAGLNEVQERVMRFTPQNLDASFAMANELAKAKGLKEALQIQSRHTQLQMHAFSLQAQELGSLMNEAAQKAKLSI